MTKERWKLVQENDNEQLTAAEIAQGWHFCYEFDGLLRQPQDEDDVLHLKGEGFKCTCVDL